jgi:hypothetical protein
MYEGLERSRRVPPMSRFAYPRAMSIEGDWRKPCSERLGTCGHVREETVPFWLIAPLDPGVRNH